MTLERACRHGRVLGDMLSCVIAVSLHLWPNSGQELNSRTEEEELGGGVEAVPVGGPRI